MHTEPKQKPRLIYAGVFCLRQGPLILEQLPIMSHAMRRKRSFCHRLCLHDLAVSAPTGLMKDLATPIQTCYGLFEGSQRSIGVCRVVWVAGEEVPFKLFCRLRTL